MQSCKMLYLDLFGELCTLGVFGVGLSPCCKEVYDNLIEPAMVNYLYSSAIRVVYDNHSIYITYGELILKVFVMTWTLI
jgi:hypothetical protein